MQKPDEAISAAFAAYLGDVHGSWRGREKQLVLELVRSLDYAAFISEMDPSTARDARGKAMRHYIRVGAAFALRPLLETIDGDPTGVPWHPTDPELATFADRHLEICGAFAALKRLAALERYGLAKTSLLADDHLSIEVVSDEEDRSDVESEGWLRYTALVPLLETRRSLAAMKNEIAARIDRYVAVDREWFIRYDTDEVLVAYHRAQAEIACAGIPEMSALPDEAILGGRSFVEWNRSSIEACRRILHHIAFATRLRATTPGLDLRNLLTVFALKEDIHAVWRESGETHYWAERVVAGLALGASSAAKCERDFEIPLPYYIDFGRHHYLLPVFGGLMNPGAGLVWHLRREYRTDWDRVVDLREQVFREDLRSLFSPETHLIPSHGFKLRRADGTVITDVDAVIVEKRSGALALLQLKWFDIYGRSLAERHSKRSNLLKANAWVQKVSEWIAGRSADETAKALGLQGAGKDQPLLLIVARHAASFGGERDQDPRANWISWPKLARTRSESAGQDLRTLLQVAKRQLSSQGWRRKNVSFQLPNLTVDVREV